MNQNRRDFLVTSMAAGGSFMLGVSKLGNAIAAAGPREAQVAGGTAASMEFTPWIVISPDSTVTVRVATPEIGNGVITQALMTVTEELHCDWKKLRSEYASPQRNYVEDNVYAKSTARYDYAFFARATEAKRMETLLQAGASARERLKEAAAQTWGVPRVEIEAKDSVLTHIRTRRTLTYGQVAARAASVRLDTEPAPKPHQDWWFLGKANPPRVQQPLLVNGSAVFGIDVKVPNMVHAALVQSPVHGGRLKSYDFDKIRNMPGVIGVAVIDPDEARPAIDPKRTPYPIQSSAAQSGIAVVAEHYWQAKTALEALPVTWDDGPGTQWKTHEQMVRAFHEAIDKDGGKVLLTKGAAARVLESSAKVVDAIYHVPFAEHAHMEPLNGTALVTADRVDVWHPTQQAQQAHIIAAQETGMAPEKVHFHQTLVGGGFGRRSFGDDVRMVVAVAKKFPGRPVKVIWSREETTRQGRYRSMETARLRAALGPDGLPEAFHLRAAGAPGLFPRYLHDGPLSAGLVENVHVETQVVPVHVMTGPYRAPGYNSNAFFTETFVDECSAAAGMDPLEYRLKLYGKWPDPAWVKCLNEVATKASWGRKLPKGWGQGIAIANYGMDKPMTGATVAAVVTVEIGQQGRIRIDTVDIAVDPGTVCYHDGVASQMEGGALFALNMALNERLTVENGRIVEGNFDEYPMLRLADAPKRISVHFGAVSGHSRTAWVGESPIAPVAAALGNAIYAATGKRLRSTPFRLHDVTAA